jgi:glucose-6-phosphate 1-dehydrogenase
MASHDGDVADLLVIFGITGDLAQKMTFRSLYRLEQRRLLDFPIIGVARGTMPSDELVKRAREAIINSGEHPDESVFDRLARRLRYISGEASDNALYHKLGSEIGLSQRPLYYLEVPPSLFGPIVTRLGRAGLVRDGRVAVEKPFGYDLDSARVLNAELHKVLREDQILRVDHFLGKEPVIGLECLRFANFSLAELWDRKSVSCVQITMAEDFGVEGRGKFYDAVGALRDVVQNHLMQVLALAAMDPPAGGSANDTQDKKAEVFRAMPPVSPQRCVRGQYEGYADVPGVAPGSGTETYIALRLGIENWRWADVPIFLRAGKGLPHLVTEIRLLLRRTPGLAFLPMPGKAEPNQIVLRIDPAPGMRLQLTALAEDSSRTVHLGTSFTRELGEPLEPYERLLHAAIVSDHRLFTRQDSIEETWRILQPVLTDPPAVRPYQRGSWGPPEAAALVRGHPRWQRPWLAEDTDASSAGRPPG